jgi:hypothetical protein
VVQVHAVEHQDRHRLQCGVRQWFQFAKSLKTYLTTQGLLLVDLRQFLLLHELALD